MTDKLREKAQQALGALEAAGYGNSYAAIELREALAELDIEEMTLTQIAARHEQAEQGPVAWIQERKRNLIKHWALDCGWDDLTEREIDDLELLINAALNAAPVRTKDLTDDEISVVFLNSRKPLTEWCFARAVIAADREKNK